MATATDLLDQATDAYRKVRAVPIGRAEVNHLARKYVSARMRYANAAGMSERDADILIKRRA